ncbi:hypothetical protein [Alysiella filiformis]|uniref:Lipoprotein n=1 Tax=Alysiella filiformis DSM 16848 TaxID=1120981 RepID=A0A286E4T6_9NEIS|nr:hypothetical protein [Alysiella filiformis]SOD65917.1 hypothetical protein SAMN02746062_00438 [Alysiella filiformis DSM 16848]
MKQTLILASILLALNGCAYTHTSVQANNNGVFGAIGSTYRW